MFYSKRVTPDFPDLKALKTLYRDAFPACERGPLDSLIQGELGGSDVLAFYDDRTFCGLACLLTVGSITHILYIAICAELRDRHYGSAAMAEIRRLYPENRIIADLEADDEAAENRGQRQARIRFYEANGFEKTAVAYRWRHENYTIYALGGTITAAEFSDFWDHAYDGGAVAAQF